MPGLVRKVMIYASNDGLLLQPHGPEHHQSLHIDYQSRRITAKSKNEHGAMKSETHLESQGIIGLINIASYSFLIAITQREQVAQIFGRPVYVIADVAILPLSSQPEACEAITAALKAKQTEEGFSDSEYSDSEDDHHSVATTDLPETPADDHGQYFQRNQSNTSIAEDVAKRKASYGKFASQWFSKQAWTSGTARTRNKHASGEPRSESEAKSSIELHNYINPEVTETNSESKEDAADQQPIDGSPKLLKSASAISLLPKILRTTRMILTSRSFYFAYEFDLTRRFSLQEKRSQLLTKDKLDQLYFWNRRMATSFFDVGQDPFITPIIQGFVGQCTFSVTAAKEANTSLDKETQTDITTTLATDAVASQNQRPYLLTLISRRSVKRSGLRYLRRGIDDEGNCANAVETEQILSSATWDKSSAIRSFVQIRGSIPLYFSQSPYTLKPVPMLHNSLIANESAFKRHFQALKNQYGAVQVAVLVDKHGTEVSIGNAYEKMYKDLHEAGQLSDVNFDWFDFHFECRGMKFENVQRLVDKLQPKIAAWGETVLINDEIKKKQEGVIRTNCMDCLDRTNVAQSAFAQHVLQGNLKEDGYDIDLIHDESTNWFNILWADNGDAISRQYASTAALKGDFTRTRKRNWRGQMNDLGLTLSRYYSNMVNDYFSQTVIDYLLANVSWRIFEDFESTMMSVDPGISVESARQAAIENCAKIVIQDSDEDLVHGWTMMTPAQENTLRTMPFEQAVVLLTNAAVYCCKFDWETEKVASFEKVDLRSISKIRIGTYVTSTFTERQLNEQLNQGLVIIFTPGKGDVIRVNTRSLRNAVASEDQSRVSSSEGGILSWFTRGASQTSRTLALKVIPRSMLAEIDLSETSQPGDMPHAIASRVSEEIKRAVVGSGNVHDFPDFVEEGEIISAADARRRTGYLEQLGYSLKKMVWA